MFNQTHEIDRTDRIDQTDQTDQMDQTDRDFPQPGGATYGGLSIIAVSPVKRRPRIVGLPLQTAGSSGINMNSVEGHDDTVRDFEESRKSGAEAPNGKYLLFLGFYGRGLRSLFSFAAYPVASGLRSRSGYEGGVGCCGELHSDWSEGTAESKAALVS